jgi:mycofactocin precursor
MEGTPAPALDQPTESDAPETPELIADELLVEEISIDGMCGVY